MTDRQRDPAAGLDRQMNPSQLQSVDPIRGSTAMAASVPSITPLHLAAWCFRGITWRRVGLVTLFCAIYGILLSLDPKSGGVARSMEAYLVGFAESIEVFLPAYLIVAVTANFAPRRPVSRAVLLGAAVIPGVAVGYGTATILQQTGMSLHASSTVPFMMVGWLGVAIHLLHERDSAAEQNLHDEAARQLELERQMSDAQLRVLQSQIEPHFLFNTLAHLRRLYRTDPDAGCAMMRHLSRYLSAALPAMRESDIGLGQDLDLALAYLNVQQI